MTDEARKLLLDSITELKIAYGNPSVPDHLHPSSNLIERIRRALAT